MRTSIVLERLLIFQICRHDRKHLRRFVCVLFPYAKAAHFVDPDYDWLFSTEPQSRLDDRAIELGRGKVLGGTSALNFMAHTRSVNNIH